MEAIVRISGKQYRVAEGDRVTVDRLDTAIGEKVSFDEVLLLSDGAAARAQVGQPLIEGATVTATVMARTRGPKLIVYKYKAKKRYRRTRGARAEQSLLQVLSVSGPSARARTAVKEAAKPAEKPATPAAPKPARAEPAKPAAAETARAEPAAETAKAESATPAVAETAKPGKTARKSAAKPRAAKPAAARKAAPKAKQE